MIASILLAHIAVGVAAFGVSIGCDTEPLDKREVLDDLVVCVVLGPVIIVGFVVIEGCQWAGRKWRRT